MGAALPGPISCIPIVTVPPPAAQAAPRLNLCSSTNVNTFATVMESCAAQAWYVSKRLDHLVPSFCAIPLIQNDIGLPLLCTGEIADF